MRKSVIKMTRKDGQRAIRVALVFLFAAVAAPSVTARRAIPSAQSSRNGAIAGRILSKNGSPASGVDVAVVPVDQARTVTSKNPKRNLSITDSAVVVRTNGAGSYRVENFPPGRYNVAAGALQVCPPAAGCAVGRWLEQPTYHPGVSNLADARPVIVSSGATVEAEVRLTE